MTPALLRLQIDESDARGNVLRAQLGVAECRTQELPTRQRMLRERERQWEQARARLEAAMGEATTRKDEKGRMIFSPPSRPTTNAAKTSGVAEQ